MPKEKTPPNAGQTKPTVLIVEDDEFLQDVLLTKFKSLGIEALVAESGKKALALMKEKKPVLVLLDLVMSDTDGFEVLRRAEADKEIARIPIVVLSNLGQESDIERAKSLGARDFLVKAHYTPSEIIEKIKHFLPHKTKS